MDGGKNIWNTAANRQAQEFERDSGLTLCLKRGKSLTYATCETLTYTIDETLTPFETVSAASI